MADENNNEINNPTYGYAYLDDPSSEGDHKEDGRWINKEGGEADLNKYSGIVDSKGQLTDHKPTGKWAIYSDSKPIPGIGGWIVDRIGGVHNYLELVDPDGHIVEEMHGIQTGSWHKEPGNYLQVRFTRRHGYLPNERILHSDFVTEGSEAEIKTKFLHAYTTVASIPNEKKTLYDAYDPINSDPNSNSVWSNALSDMGVINYRKYEGLYQSPGDNVNLSGDDGNNDYYEGIDHQKN